jgi:hypothetical protein
MITKVEDIDDLTVTIKLKKGADGDLLLDINTSQMLSNRMMLTVLYSIAESAESSLKAEIQSMMAIDKAKMH